MKKIYLTILVNESTATQKWGTIALVYGFSKEVKFNALDWDVENPNLTPVCVPTQPEQVWGAGLTTPKARLSKMWEIAIHWSAYLLPGLVMYEDGNTPTLLAILSPTVMALVTKLTLEGEIDFLNGVNDGTDEFTFAECLAVQVGIEHAARELYEETQNKGIVASAFYATLTMFQPHCQDILGKYQVELELGYLNDEPACQYKYKGELLDLQQVMNEMMGG